MTKVKYDRVTGTLTTSRERDCVREVFLSVALLTLFLWTPRTMLSNGTTAERNLDFGVTNQNSICRNQKACFAKSQ